MVGDDNDRQLPATSTTGNNSPVIVGDDNDVDNTIEDTDGGDVIKDNDGPVIKTGDIETSGGGAAAATVAMAAAS